MPYQDRGGAGNSVLSFKQSRDNRDLTKGKLSKLCGLKASRDKGLRDPLVLDRCPSFHLVPVFVVHLFVDVNRGKVSRKFAVISKTPKMFVRQQKHKIIV